MAPAIGALATSWLLLLATAPMLWTSVAALLYAGGSIICHQLPERSFHIGGVQLPVCARCFGLYAGGALGSVAAAVAFRAGSVPARLQRDVQVLRRLLHTRSGVWIATVIAALPTAVTVVVEWVIGWPVSNVVRASAAVPLGATAAFVVVGALATLHYDSCVPPRPIGSNRSPTST